MTELQPILTVADLAKHFTVCTAGGIQNTVKAVDGVSFEIQRGETMSLVGESGCGKSTTGRLILRLLKATAGQVRFEGADVLSANKKQVQTFRRQMQFIFQDPFAALNPKMTVGDIVREPLDIYQVGSGTERIRQTIKLLETVGLSRQQADRYPAEFSGGQRQRVCIARALALQPKLVICDEPVSALDVSIQAQIINLLRDLQEEFQLTYLFISHDLSVVKHISDRVAVMYLGKIVEIAAKETLFAAPAHPYTQALLSAIPVPNPKIKRKRILLEGEAPNPINPPQGCQFCTRCPQAQAICYQIPPVFCRVGTGQMAACHLLKSA
jgi:oligopeptide transport system ATP-binding protein